MSNKSLSTREKKIRKEINEREDMFCNNNSDIIGHNVPVGDGLTASGWIGNIKRKSGHLSEALQVLNSEKSLKSKKKTFIEKKFEEFDKKFTVTIEGGRYLINHPNELKSFLRQALQEYKSEIKKRLPKKMKLHIHSDCSGNLIRERYNEVIDEVNQVIDEI